VRGARARHLIAYRRRLGDHELLMLVPRLPAGLCGGRSGLPLGAEVWHDTRVELGAAPRDYRDLCSGLTVRTDGALAVGAVLTHFPVAALCTDGTITTPRRAR
jgi:maltooligosyltrehalose synthase